MARAILVLALMFGMSCATLTPLTTVKSPIPDQYVIIFEDSGDVKAESAVVSEITGVEILQEYTHVLKGVAVRLSNPGALARIQTLKFVTSIAQDGNVTAQVMPIEQRGKVQETAMTWGLDRVDQRSLPLDGISSFTGDGQGVNVYILDSGIYPDHEYFGGRARVAYDVIDDGRMGEDCNGHGTHNAGVIGAEHYGIARSANLWGVRVLNCDNRGSYSELIEGMDWVAAHHIKPAVASMSLGGAGYDPVDQAVRGLYDAGVPSSVGAGSKGGDACERSPGRAPWAITVGATDKTDYRSWWSDYGSCVDIYAPGVNVLSTSIGYPTATKTSGGTSAAHVTGAIALALGNNPALTPKQVWEKLKAESTKGVVQDKGPLSPDRLLFIP